MIERRKETTMGLQKAKQFAACGTKTRALWTGKKGNFTDFDLSRSTGIPLPKSEKSPPRVDSNSFEYQVSKLEQ